jgi:hypothetical protein
MAQGYLSLLQIVQQFAARTGLAVPSQVIDSTDPGVRQMAALLNEGIEEMVPGYEWTDMLQQCTFNTQGQSNQGPISTLTGFPTDYILNDILWDTTTRLPIFGPVGAQRWEQYKALPITGTLLQYRLEQGNLLLYPLTPPVGDVIIFEAMMLYPIVDNVTTPGTPIFKQYFQLDTDQCVFKDRITINSLRWRYKREKGLAYAEDQKRYSDLLELEKMRNGTGRILNMNGDEENFGPGILVPSGSWNIMGGGLPGGAWDSTLG